MKQTLTTPRYKPPIAAIKIGAADRRGTQTLYGRGLVWLMRGLSVLWVLQGLHQWGAVLTADGDGAGTLDTMTSTGIAAIMFFCVIDLIAAVGLWLAAAWGGVVWLVAVAAQWLAILILPGFLDYDLVTGLLDLAFVALYLFATFMAAREQDM